MTQHYTDAHLAKLLREQGHDVTFKVRPPRKKSSNEESLNQQAVIRWWAKACRPQFGIPEHMLMGIPLQGARTPKNGSRMKKEGLRKGTLDLFLAVGRGGSNGLWIEMKTADGVVTPEQTAMITDLNLQNYTTAVCRSAMDAIEEIKIYLRVSR